MQICISKRTLLFTFTASLLVTGCQTSDQIGSAGIASKNVSASVVSESKPAQEGEPYKPVFLDTNAGERQQQSDVVLPSVGTIQIKIPQN
ncbi:hypothetical protein MSP8887_00569 [Marinomonas spartinae]|uniref:hypothetical protein n=1 Tax=Marinomonas spartinae TaxID=1792290 RepID=UPI000808EB88|nr:hypothetical protein [Marinomonas spartinae]SBS27199.1 hypothetical protein MSP8887_00569 [Marinomonas spartinae]